jgi:Protein of unknown function (DUF2914)
VTSVLAADDPVVITSGKNLRDFCDGYGRPFELRPPPPTVAPQSEPATTDAPAAPGTFFFYTRLKSGRETTVQHQCYYKGSLVQNATRRIGANEDTGYRTYSRHTVIATRTGDWRVELRTAAGALLLEERFVVR